MDTQLILLSLIGIFASILGTLAGGAGLITLPAMMLFGIPIHTGIATNKFSTAMGSLTSVIYLLRKKEITIKEVSIFLFIAFAGGMSGAYATTHVSEQTMNWIALILIFFAFFVTIKNKSLTSNVNTTEKPKSWFARTLPFYIGVYDGGFGPGATTFAIIHFIKGNQTYLKAVQYSRALILGSGFGAFLLFVQTSYFNWSYAIAMAIGSIIGSQIGLFILPHVPMKAARILLTSILVLLMAQISYQLL